MPRRSNDSEKSGDYNWRRLWETPSNKSQRRYARAWIHPLPGDPLICKALAIPKHPTGPSEFSTMTSNPANLAPEDQFLLWCQELEARQEEQARKVAELCEQANRLREENERLRTQLEADRDEQSREPPRPFPPFRPGKGKEAVVPDDIDLSADDKLSSGGSPLLRRSPSLNAAEDHSRKRSPCRSSRSVSIARRWMRREPSRDQRPPTPAHQYVPDRTGGLLRPVPNMYPPIGAAPHRKQFLPPPFGDYRTCFPLPLDSISWTMILPVAFPYHPSPCTTVLPIRTITCYIIIRQ